MNTQYRYVAGEGAADASAEFRGLVQSEQPHLDAYQVTGSEPHNR